MREGEGEGGAKGWGKGNGRGKEEEEREGDHTMSCFGKKNSFLPLEVGNSPCITGMVT